MGYSKKKQKKNARKSARKKNLQKPIPCGLYDNWEKRKKKVEGELTVWWKPLPLVAEIGQAGARNKRGRKHQKGGVPGHD